jgi:DNA-binding response OmpR family regulator
VPEILVIEDESVIRAALRRFLERNKFRVAEAASVSEARSNHRLERFDLIITDLRLSGAPGTDIIQSCGDVPVLIMTSYASLRSAVDAMLWRRHMQQEASHACSAPTVCGFGADRGARARACGSHGATELARK